MTIRTLTRPTDTMAWQSMPAKINVGLSYLGVNPGASDCYAHFPAPFSEGATVVLATLRLRASTTPLGGGLTVNVQAVSEQTDYSRLTWETRPATAGPTASLTSTAADGLDWNIDVTSIMQHVAAGGFWGGFEITGTGTGAVFFRSSEWQGDDGPTLTVEWAESPDMPLGLTPDGGLATATTLPTLQFVYGDNGGGDLLTARVQIAEDEAMSVGVWDSGDVPVPLAELDLSDTSYAGLPGGGGERFWRVRVTDSAGLLSGWSDVASMRYAGHPALTITEPTSAVLMDSTPTVRWSFAGTQSQYQVIVWRADLDQWPVWDSGRLVGTRTALTVRDGILRDDKDYRVQVRIWDDVGRVSTPGSPAYALAEVTLRFDDDAAVPAPTSVAATPWPSGQPFVDVEWETSGTADAFVLVRDGAILGRFDPGDVEVEAGARYRWTDRTCPGWDEATYKVGSIIDGRLSVGTTASCYVKLTGVWLTTETDSVPFVGVDGREVALGSRETVHQVGDRVVVINDGLRGHEGTYAGWIEDDRLPGVSAQQARETLMGMRRSPTGVRLHMARVNVPIVLSSVNIVDDTMPSPGYVASFAYHQKPGMELLNIDRVG